MKYIDMLRAEEAREIPVEAKPVANLLGSLDYRVQGWILKGPFICFDRNTIDGLICVGPQVLQLVAVNNDPRGNGEFGRLMESLEQIARELRLDVAVVEIWNRKLAKRLEHRWGYTMSRDNRGLVATKSLPR